MSEVVYSTRTGKDVLISAIKDYTFRSDINMIKYGISGHGTASVSTGVVWTLDITHNQGYKPSVLFYFKHPGNNRWYLAPGKGDINSDATWSLNGSFQNTNENTTQLRLYDDDIFDPMPSSPTDIEYKYFILVEPRQGVWYE